MFRQIKNYLHAPDSKYTVKQTVRWLWRAWKGNRLQAAINATLGLLGVGVSLASVWAVKHAIDVASGTVDGSIYWAVGLMAALVLCEFGISIAGVWVRNILGIRAQNRMQQRMLDRILRSEWHGRESHHSGDVLNRLEFDVGNVVNFLTETIPSTLSVLAMFFGAFFYLFSMDQMLACIIVVMIPLFAIVSKIYIRKMRQLTRQVRDSDSKVQSVLQETIQNRMLIKTLESDTVMVDKLENTQSELRHHVVKRTAFSVFSNLILNFGFALGYLVAFLWSALRLADHTLTFGGMTAFLQLVNKVQGPARSLTKLIPAFVSVFTAAERLMELEEIPEELQGDAHLLEAPCGVRFENVTYQYPQNPLPTVVNATYDFAPGTCTAILGETGSGKTTMIRLLLALIAPQQGRIAIYNGEHEQALTPLHRCNFVYVPQGNTLLSGTLRDNLRIGAPDATDEQMTEALQTACAQFALELPDGLDTTFAEQGGGLSEGQAQRIAIARALLRPGSIILLDEATSALDADTERQLLDNLLRNQQRTVIFVTHRQAVVDYCDHIIRVE